MSVVSGSLRMDSAGASLLQVNRMRGAAVIALTLLSFLFIRYLSAHHTVTGINHDEAYILNLAEQIYEGHGFVTPVLWQLYLQPEALPMPYGGAAGPLPSILIALLYIAFGYSEFLTHLPGIVLGSLIAPAVFLLASRLGLSAWRSFAAGCVTALHPFLANNANKIMTDIPAAAFIMFAFLFLYSRPTLGSNILLGVMWGLAYLCRYQALLFGAVVVLSWVACRQRRGRDVMITTAAFLLTALPWFIRNLIVFGNPLFSYASEYFWLIAHVPEQVQLVRRTTEPPDQVQFLMVNWATYLSASLGRVKAIFFHTLDVLIPNAALALGCVLGVVRLRKELVQFLPLILYVLIMGAFFLSSYLEPRYLISGAPLVVIGGVGGISFISRNALQPGKQRKWLEALAIVIILGAYMVVDGVRLADTEGDRSIGGKAETAYQAREFFSRHAPWSFTIMATAPEYCALFHKQYAVSLPLETERDLWAVIGRYRVRYLVMQDPEVRDLQRLPQSVREGLVTVYRGPNTHIFEVRRGEDPSHLDGSGG